MAPQDGMDGAFPEHHIAYQNRFDSYKLALEGLCLTGTLELDVETKVWTMVESVQNILQNSAQHYVFRSPEDYDSQYRHDCLALGLLRYHDRGTIRGAFQYARMEPSPITAEKTINDLARDTNNFAVAKLALREGRFLVNLCKGFLFVCVVLVLSNAST